MHRAISDKIASLFRPLLLFQSAPKMLKMKSWEAFMLVPGWFGACGKPVQLCLQALRCVSKWPSW